MASAFKPLCLKRLPLRLLQVPLAAMRAVCGLHPPYHVSFKSREEPSEGMQSAGSPFEDQDAFTGTRDLDGLRRRQLRVVRRRHAALVFRQARKRGARALRHKGHIAPASLTRGMVINYNITDQVVEVSDRLAFSRSVQPMMGKKLVSSLDIWTRSTICFRKEDNNWKVIHVHNSVPFTWMVA